ncbi:RNA-directed DNA polymerase from mobile element jockey [Stylophora pistillata]|uniref:RNA-directed DNA polymerase from mobile element jockey n=1 Tax=Stylophora pistillata TaxID=50429 RepID=A0A2B4RZC1_STYPI|nr:RNA-directed DNA polymerase from mobile element jockey [Stylophora pistillata]
MSSMSTIEIEIEIEIENERVITDSLMVAEMFNNYFCEVSRSDGDSKEMVEFVDHPSVKVIAEKTCDDVFDLVPVDVGYIRKILDTLDPRKAVGCDKISQRLLRLSSPVIAEPVTRLINYFITNRQWPIVWKSSDVVPVFKKESMTDKTCYRPVSVLTSLSKLYEKVLFDQIYEAFHWRLSPNLSGFLKGHSCCTALLKLTEDWRACLDRREAVAAVAIDLSKAFDSVCHPLLLAKLKAYGFTHDALETMTAYLTGRRQRVKLDGVYSSWRTVKTGVPQGSLLGPLLFNLYVNDLNYFITNTSLRLYADDTTHYASDVSPTVLQYIINSDLSVLSRWFSMNFLQINAAKTQAIAIGPSSYQYDFHLNDSNVHTKDTLKILGVVLDSKLTFKAHIKQQLNKGCAKASALRRIQSVNNVAIGENLSHEQRAEFMDLANQFQSLFTEAPGTPSLAQHHIKLTSDQPVRSVPYSLRESLKKGVTNLMKMGVIRESSSPYASPVVVVKKKDNTNWICVDYRKLNKLSVFDPEPMPTAEHLFQKLSGDKYFTRIDLSKGY